MTTTVHIYSSHVMDDCRLELIALDATIAAITVAFDGPTTTMKTVETILDPDIGHHRIVTHLVHGTRELVLREVKREPAA
jgi:hypothetical protein